MEIVLAPRIVVPKLAIPAGMPPKQAVEMAKNGSAFHALPANFDDSESLEEATRRIAVKYAALERNSRLLAAGKLPSLIASGPPGLGKSYTMECALRDSKRQRHDSLTPVDNGSEWFDYISGGSSAPGLYHSLWNMREGGLVVLDDCDVTIFNDLEALNLIKIATDSSKQRILSWRKQASWLEKYEISRTFEFKGHVGFLTNIDFEQVIKRHTKDTEHYKALIDRARYICLTIRTQRDFMIRIRAVAAGLDGMLCRVHGLSLDDSEMILAYIEEHKMRFYNLSLRLVGQIADQYLTAPDIWREDIEATKMRTSND